MNRLEQTLDVGSADLFPMAREAILTWKLQESAGMVARPARRVHVGQIGDLRLNPVYRTLPGHLESGEQTFLVSVGADERLAASITSESVPRHPLLRAFASMSVAAQRMTATRCAEGMQLMLRQSDRRSQSDRCR